MRIDWLKVPDYRNLRNFAIDFDTNEPISVLLGQNSSGKSNLIECIVEIFRELDSGKPTSFEYSIRYLCNDKTIEVHCDPTKARKLTILIDEKAITVTEFNKNKENYLPQFIFGYYSGWNERLEKQFDEKTRRYYYDVLKNYDTDMPYRRFFFLQKRI